MDCRVFILTGLFAAAASAPAAPSEVPTFEDGKMPATEIHVDPGGNDGTGDGSAGNPYRTIERGVQDAVPGAAVRVHAGTYDERVNVSGLSGTAAAPIWIGGAPGETRPIIQGGTEGMHLTRVRYLIVHDLEVRNTSQNGINCDDGGDYANPDATRHLIFRGLSIHDVGGTGNQDGLKLSGVDDYFVLDSEFARCGGGNSGSGVDHVGCHGGVIANNYFHELSANAVQCKGGSEDIEIRANRMLDVGQRSVNLGGSTDFAFFRPPLSETQPNFEAKNIRMRANLIEGGIASLAFVGCVDCVAENNTIINPTNWLVRILQETTSTPTYSFLECANNRVTNNLFYFDRSALANSNINIGAGTQPATFTWENNLWYAHNDSAQSTPNPAPSQSNAVIGQDPRFVDAAGGDFHLAAGSPAIGSGKPHGTTIDDFDGAPFKASPAIGAFEVSAWQGWRQTHFPTLAQLDDAAVSGPMATPAGDEVYNFVKFAFNLSPWNDGPERLPVPALANDRLTFSYGRLAGSDRTVAVLVRVSSDLSQWWSGPGHTVMLPPADQGDGTEWVTVEDVALASPADGGRFMQALVTFLE